MKIPSRRPWTKAEKWLLLAPALVGVFALVSTLGPDLVRKSLGYPSYILKTEPGHRLYYISLSGDGSTLAATGYNQASPLSSGKIWLWNARTMQLKTIWPSRAKMAPPPRVVRGDWTSGLALSPDAKTLVVTRDDTPLTAYNTQTQGALWSVGKPETFRNTLFSSDGTRLAFTEDVGLSYRYVVLNAADGSIVSQWTANQLPPYEADFAWAPDGKTIACVGPRLSSVAPTPQTLSRAQEGRNVQIRRVTDGKLLRTIGNPRTHSMVFSPDGTTLAVVSEPYPRLNHGGSRGHTVRCFSTTTAQKLWELKLPQDRKTFLGVIKSATYSPDGTLLALHRGNSVELLDAFTGVSGQRLQWSGDEDLIINANVLASSPDGRRLFARSKEAVLVWDLN